MSALDDFLADQVDDAIDEARDHLEAPANLEQAEWQMRKLAKLRKQAATNEAIANVEIARIRFWLAQENDKLAHQAEFYETALAAFHRAMLADDPTRKTISLPAGVLKARKHPDTWTVDDPVFVTWAADNAPHLLRTKVEPAKSELRKHAVSSPVAVDDVSVLAVLKETGEEIPGVAVTRGDIAFVVDTDVKRGEVQD